MSIHVKRVLSVGAVFLSVLILYLVGGPTSSEDKTIVADSVFAQSALDDPPVGSVTVFFLKEARFQGEYPAVPLPDPVRWEETYSCEDNSVLCAVAARPFAEAPDNTPFSQLGYTSYYGDRPQYGVGLAELYDRGYVLSMPDGYKYKWDTVYTIEVSGTVDGQNVPVHLLAENMKRLDISPLDATTIGEDFMAGEQDFVFLWD